LQKLKVGGMSCQHCAKAVAEALSALEGVTNVDVDLGRGIVSFESIVPVPDAVLQQAVEAKGFEYQGPAQ
jgi:copper chaperone